MKRGTRKAVKLGMRMLRWLEENDDRKKEENDWLWQNHQLNITTRIDLDFVVLVSGHLKSHKTVNKFKREFGEISRLERDSYDDELVYRGDAGLVDIPLKVEISGISEMPKNCRVVTKRVWYNESTFPARFVDEKSIVCNDAS